MNCCGGVKAAPLEPARAAFQGVTRQASGDDPANPGGPTASNVRLGELHFLAAVRPGEWAKAGEVLSVLERRIEDREVCREAAKAAEAIASQEAGLDALTDLGGVQMLARVWQKHQNDTVLAVHVSHVASRYWERAGNDSSWYLRAACLDVGRALVDTGRLEWLVELHRMAVRIHSKGHFDAAGDTYKLSIERFQSSLGSAHANTLQAQNNYAVLLEERGQLEDAEKLHRTVCEQCERSLGADDPTTLSSLLNLAVLKLKQGATAEAEKLYRNVLQRREQTMGEEHPDTLRAKNNLAGLLRRAGRLPEAEVMYVQVAKLRRTALGEDHPETLRARCSLALTLAEQGDQAKRSEAEALLREVQHLRENRLGRDHPETLRTLSHLAVILEASQPKEAQALHEQVLMRLDAAAPEESKRTRAVHSDSVSRLEAQGELPKAEALLRQVVERRVGALGADHADALSALAELGALLARRGAAEEAEGVLREVARRCEKAQGAGHMDTLTAKAALAASLRRAESAEVRAEARALHLDALGRFDDILRNCRQNTEGAGAKQKVAVLVSK